MELTYRKCGDYYIPNLTLGDTDKRPVQPSQYAF